jgi:hypothetical protein
LLLGILGLVLLVGLGVLTLYRLARSWAAARDRLRPRPPDG